MPLSAVPLMQLLEESAMGHHHLLYLYGLKRHRAEPDKDSLHELGRRAQASIEVLQSENEKQVYRLKLACYAYDAGLLDISGPFASLYMKELTRTSQFVHAALKFKKHGMADYVRVSALKAVQHMQKGEESWGRDLRPLFKELKEPDALEKVLLRLVSEEDRCFIRLSEYHADLHAIGKALSAKSVAQKVIQVIETKFPEGAGWYLHVALDMHKRGALSDTRLLMERAFQGDNLSWLYGMRWLIGHIAAAKEMGFEDLAKQGRRVFLDKFSERASISSLSSHLEKALEKGELGLAQKMCLEVLGLPGCFFHFEEGIRVIELLRGHGQESLARKIFIKVQDSCDPKEMFTLVRYRDGVTVFTPMQGLVFLAHLAIRYKWDDYLEGSVPPIISTTLAYPYFESSQHFTGFLEWLVGAMERLERRYEADTVRFYLREAQKPSLSPSPKSNFQVGEIYWVNLEGAKGAELFKTRPCLIVSLPTYYGQNKRSVVRVLPISTKENREVPRILLYVDGVDRKGNSRYVDHQEGRLDQILTVDTSRFRGKFAELKTHELRRAVLAVKHSFP